MTSPTTKDDAGQLCVPTLIDGQPVWLPSSSASFPVTSAAQQKVIHHAQTATAEMGVRAADAAWTTFKSYRRSAAGDRRRMLLRAAELFEERAAEGSARQMAETSCDEGWAAFNVHGSAGFCRSAAAAVDEALRGSVLPTESGNMHLALKEPIGPVLQIIPWNGAIVLCARGIAAALAAGCTVVLKASELCPWTHAWVVDIFHSAGFPPGSINMVTSDRGGAAELTEALIAHRGIRKVEFIGSGAVGRVVGAVAARHCKPLVMELGDQSPQIVLDDADLGLAAELAARSSVTLHGQVCFATERVIVLRSVYDEYSRLLAAAMAKVQSGTAVSEASAQRAKAAVDDAVKRGAKFLYGNAEMLGPASLQASVLTDVHPDSILSKSEGFGPVMFVTVVDTEEEAVEEANSREGGLSAAVITRSYERGLRLSRDLEFGEVIINNVTNFAETCGPMPGRKGSGWGSHAGKYGIEAFLVDKAVNFTPTA
ncbi:hypothetical protein N3K66_002130 [Trichothecium roseum]|uniref:Uncharacterized protein n=1 Tax=Trichothecium roseum TaxID=47278 RepID=A0ACC0VAH9_9HYPO|nr:hypothetical protein N3K66_002130 [Trichothecium roseum]